MMHSSYVLQRIKVQQGLMERYFLWEFIKGKWEARVIGVQDTQPQSMAHWHLEKPVTGRSPRTFLAILLKSNHERFLCFSRESIFPFSKVSYKILLLDGSFLCLEIKNENTEKQRKIWTNSLLPSSVSSHMFWIHMFSAIMNYLTEFLHAIVLL